MKSSKVGRLGTRGTLPLFPALSVIARLWASPSPSLGFCFPTWEKREEPWASLQIREHQYSVAIAPRPTTLGLVDTALVLPTPRPHTRAPVCVRGGARDVAKSLRLPTSIFLMVLFLWCKTYVIIKEKLESTHKQW